MTTVVLKSGSPVSVSFTFHTKEKGFIVGSVFVFGLLWFIVKENLGSREKVRISVEVTHRTV